MARGKIVPGNIQWLKAGDLQFDERVNRAVRPSHVQSIVENFDPVKFGVLEVSRRTNGRGVGYFVIEGQHRTRAVTALFGDDEKVPCIVHEDMGEAQEADLFIGANAKLGQRPIEKFQKAVLAGHELETEINKAVEAAGCVVRGGQGDGHINAVNALTATYVGSKRLGGPSYSVLVTTLRILKNAFGPDHTSFHGTFIRGLGMFLRVHGDAIDADELASKLAKSGPNGLHRATAAWKDARKKSSSDSCAQAITDTYNRGRRKAKVADWLG